MIQEFKQFQPKFKAIVELCHISNEELSEKKRVYGDCKEMRSLESFLYDRPGLYVSEIMKFNRENNFINLGAKFLAQDLLWTGMYDRNDKMIFEGDYVKEVLLGGILLVQFHDNGWWGLNGFGQHVMPREDIREVVGNYFINPEFHQLLVEPNWKYNLSYVNDKGEELEI